MDTPQYNATELELAWAAGLIDGEGCFTSGRNGPRARRFRLFVVLEERDGFVLDRLYRILGVGSRYHRNRQKSWRPNCSEQEVFEVRRQSELLDVIPKLLPHMVLKHDIALSMLNELTEYVNGEK